MIARIESLKVESSLVIKALELSPKLGDIRTTSRPLKKSLASGIVM